MSNLIDQSGVSKWITKLKWWQIALLAIPISFLGSLAGGINNKRTKIYTAKLKQAPWAPPAWLFAPAWTANNVFLLMALQRILKDEEMPEKQKLLKLQAVIWVIFFSFNYIYFRKKSPVLAAVWTMSDAIAATASMLIAAKADKKTALNYLPLTLWTLFASTLAGYQALKNPDDALDTPQLLN